MKLKINYQKMESEISKVFNKIIKLSESYKSLHLTRKDLKLIRLFYVLQMVRSKSWNGNPF